MFEPIVITDVDFENQDEVDAFFKKIRGSRLKPRVVDLLSEQEVTLDARAV